ncbi:MAG: hypothetical protein HN435_14290, partial [Nitrospinaceae bacterium]|nr:hypothetical protein [Nitrospinaceae bacterium]
GWHDPADAAARLAAVEKLAASADTFEPLATTFKRVSNIIRQAAGEGGGNGDNFSEELLEDEGERILNDVLGVRSTEIEKIMASLGDIKRDENNALENAWAKVMENVTALRPAVDKFFDEVLVMAEDEKLRRNRLALLGRVGALFEPVADFSKIQGRPKE